MNISTYAPVVIPTLNRFEHFIRCFESLERCTGAENTEVYVALDYPPSEKYKGGWEQISAYLSQKEESNHFKSLHVIRRDHNYGVGRKGGNAEVLIEDVMRKYDRYIFTEDDNEFSPCFLQYMNKALTKFYDDDDIFLVCGYNIGLTLPSGYDSNYIITRKYGSPWGMGEWTHKRRRYEQYYSIEKLKDVLRNDALYHKLKKNAPDRLMTLISQIKKRELFGDGIKGIYSCLEDKYCLVPTVSMVRNWGVDGSGVHAKDKNAAVVNFFEGINISQKIDFEFSEPKPEIEPDFKVKSFTNRSLTIREIYKKMIMRVDIWLFRHINYLPQSKYL